MTLYERIAEFFRPIRTSRETMLAMAEANPHLAQAIEQEKQEGHLIAVFCRTAALLAVIILLPFINPNPDVLYYQALVLFFIGLGWLQYRVARVGQSGRELFLIFLDIALLTCVFVIPNPFVEEEFPAAFLYRFNNFIYFFLILAVASLAYSWRTVWSFGSWVAIIWLVGATLVSLFGNTVPGLDDAVASVLADYPRMAGELLPNGMQWDIRISEAIVFIMVAWIIGIKGYRSERMLIRQAEIASQRANLSRYFPSKLVDTLASADHDIGAVRSQEVAVLFTDIVGFTKLAEQNSPEDVMDLLRDYHALVEAAVFEHGGTLEKYIGDGAMATFGRPEPGNQDAAHALEAARQILEENQKLNNNREKNGQEPVFISVGVHYGPVVMGDIGPERRLEFAVIGDTVNVAARLEAETRKLDCRCVVSDALFKKIDPDCQIQMGIADYFSPKGETQLRGKTEPIKVWVA